MPRKTNGLRRITTGSDGSDGDTRTCTSAVWTSQYGEVVESIVFSEGMLGRRPRGQATSCPPCSTERETNCKSSRVSSRGRVVRWPYTKTFLPDAAACQFVLTNLQRRDWKRPKDIQSKSRGTSWQSSSIAFETLEIKDELRDARGAHWESDRDLLPVASSDDGDLVAILHGRTAPKT